MSLQMQYLREKIETARTLLGVVETMRGLAAVNIRRAEAAAEQSGHYARTVHLALHAALEQLDRAELGGPAYAAPQAASGVAPSTKPDGARSADGRRVGEPTWFVVTTDMGLCGQFNERIVAYALEQARTFAGSDGDGIPGRWIVVGMRGLERLEDAGARIVGRLDAPGSVEAIPGSVAEAVAALQNAPAALDSSGRRFGHSRPSTGRAGRSGSPTDPVAGPIFIVHNRPESGSGFHSRRLRLSPLEAARFQSMPAGESPWRAVPMTAPTPEEMLPRLVREQMYIDLFQAFVESFAAENAARLASMKNAADNIDELLEDLEGRYRQERQDAITTELMELLGGVEAVRRADE